MNESTMEQVIDRKRKLYFQDKMGFNDSLMKKLATPVAGGVTLTTASAILVAILGTASLPVLVKAAMFFGLMTNPWVLAAWLVAALGTLITAFNAAHITYKAYMTKELKRHFGSCLDVLGKRVSDIIFLPAIGMAMADGKMSERARKVILKEYRDWGFSEAWCNAEIARAEKQLTSDAILVSVAACFAKQPSAKQLEKQGLSRDDIDLAELKKAQLKLAEKVMLADNCNPGSSQTAYLEKLKKIHCKSWMDSFATSFKAAVKVGTLFVKQTWENSIKQAREIDFSNLAKKIEPIFANNPLPKLPMPWR